MNLVSSVHMEVVSAEDWWVISDVHGCYEELIALLDLVYLTSPKASIAYVGDFVDRGPQPAEVLGYVRESLQNKRAVAVLGNHDWKLYRAAVLGRDVKVAHGLGRTLELTTASQAKFLGKLPRQVHITSPGMGGVCTVVHAGMPYSGVGVKNKFTESHALYGEVDGYREDGYPNRAYSWADTWEGKSGMCVFGHDRKDKVTYLKPNVVAIDTGCAFGGKLTAYNPKTKHVLSVPAQKNYAELLS